MTSQIMTERSTVARVCPYCGRTFPIVTIPALWGIPERVVQSRFCGCDGEVEAERKYMRQRKVEERESILRKSGFPRRYWDIPSDDTYLGAIESGGLFIHGQVGRGKTWLATATAKAWMNRHRGKKVVFTDSTSLFASIRESYDSGYGERGAMWRYTNADLLVFDDFAKGRPSEWSLERVEAIVQSRYEDMLPTIFTCQWAGTDLIRRLAEGGSEESAKAIVSRIVQTCGMAELTGPDRRMQGLRQ